MRTNNIVQTTIPVDEAIVQERSVSAKVLTIGTKQVTQSLYKQLICDTDVIDHGTCELKGKIWGWVNLHVDCDQDKAHLHAVWEKGGCLYRSCTYRKCNQIFYVSSECCIEALAKIYCYLMALEGQKDQLMLYVRRDEKYVRLFHKGNECSNLMARVVVKKRFIEVPVSTNIRTTTSRHYLNEHIEKFIYEADLCGYPVKSLDLSSDTIYSKMEELADTMNKEEGNWRKAYQQICDAGQLFIAVSGVWK